MIWFVLGIIVGVVIMCCVQINHDNDEVAYWKFRSDCYERQAKKFYEKLKEGDSNGKQRD